MTGAVVGDEKESVSRDVFDGGQRSDVLVDVPHFADLLGEAVDDDDFVVEDEKVEVSGQLEDQFFEEAADSLDRFALRVEKGEFLVGEFLFGGNVL